MWLKYILHAYILLYYMVGLELDHTLSASKCTNLSVFYRILIINTDKISKILKNGNIYTERQENSLEALCTGGRVAATYVFSSSVYFT